MSRAGSERHGHSGGDSQQTVSHRKALFALVSTPHAVGNPATARTVEMTHS
jgi:hypothetical protein